MATSTLIRAEVKQETLAAARAGEWMPAGDIEEDSSEAHMARAEEPKYLRTASTSVSQLQARR